MIGKGAIRNMATYFGRTIDELHCVHCCCPKEIWEPMKTYPSDNSCLFYEDVYSAACDIEHRDDFITYDSLLRECISLKNQYPDIPDFEAAIKECFDIFDDTGAFKIKPSLKIISGGTQK